MKLIHAADVHFGASDPAVLAAASDAIMAAGADMMLVSGDLTQRVAAIEMFAGYSAVRDPQVISRHAERLIFGLL